MRCVLIDEVDAVGALRDDVSPVDLPERVEDRQPDRARDPRRLGRRGRRELHVGAARLGAESEADLRRLGRPLPPVSPLHPVFEAGGRQGSADGRYGRRREDDLAHRSAQCAVQRPLVGEPDLGLRRVHVHVDVGGRQLELDDGDRVSAGRERGIVSLLDRIGERAALNPPSIGEEGYRRAGRPRRARL